MANLHPGNLADLFKHLALAELLGAMRPGEYWESHAGAMLYPENSTPPAEREHGIHTFLKVAGDFEPLRTSRYHRILTLALKPTPTAAITPGQTQPHVPGSPLLARIMLGDNIRRLLFCDTDAESLQTITTPLKSGAAGTRSATLDKVECVQDDGISVLRGAGVMLSEQWTGSTLAFIDPHEMDEATDAGISPLDLCCELANRGIPVVMWYGFADEAGRAARHQAMMQKLEKARLLKKMGQRFEGSLKSKGEGKPPTQWGFGLMMLNFKTEPLERVEQVLRALSLAYEKASLPGWAGGSAGSGAWGYHRLAL